MQGIKIFIAMKKINHLTLILSSAVLMAIMIFGEIYRSYPPFLVLTVISLLISLSCLFLIHHRTLQMRLCVYNAIILLAYQIWIVVLFISLKKGGLTLDRFPVSVVFPIICVILNFLAASMIRKAMASEAVMKIIKKGKVNNLLRKDIRNNRSKKDTKDLSQKNKKG